MSDTTMREWLDESIELIQAGCQSSMVFFGIPKDSGKIDLDEVVNEVWLKMVPLVDRFNGDNWAGFVYSMAYFKSRDVIMELMGFDRFKEGKRVRSQVSETDYGTLPDRIEGLPVDMLEDLNVAMEKLKKSHPRIFRLVSSKYLNGPSKAHDGPIGIAMTNRLLQVGRDILRSYMEVA